MRAHLAMIILLFGSTLTAQNDPFMSHYMLNPTVYNPAWAGYEPVANATMQIRSQWTGYSSSFDQGGAPFTQVLTAMVPVRGVISGTGISIVNDNLGPVSNFMLNVPVTYKIENRKGDLILSISPGIFSQTQKFSLLRPGSPGDPVIPVGGDQSQVNFNLNAGLLYSFVRETYLGIGVTNLLEPGFDYGLDSLQNVMERSFTMIGGFRRGVGKALQIAPSVLVRSDLNTFSFDLSLLVYLQKRMWLGLSYRWDEAVIFIFGYSFLPDERLKLGYAMDYVVAGQDAKQATSQEIYLRYDLPDLVIGGRKRIKTPRFTY